MVSNAPSRVLIGDGPRAGMIRWSGRDRNATRRDRWTGPTIDRAERARSGVERVELRRPNSPPAELGQTQILVGDHSPAPRVVPPGSGVERIVWSNADDRSRQSGRGQLPG